MPIPRFGLRLRRAELELELVARYDSGWTGAVVRDLDCSSSEMWLALEVGRLMMTLETGREGMVT